MAGAVDYWCDAFELLDFIAGAGRGKTLPGTGFPVVGYRQALARLDALSLDQGARAELCGGAARRMFTRIAVREDRS